MFSAIGKIVIEFRFRCGILAKVVLFIPERDMRPEFTWDSLS